MRNEIVSSQIYFSLTSKYKYYIMKYEKSLDADNLIMFNWYSIIRIFKDVFFVYDYNILILIPFSFCHILRLFYIICCRNVYICFMNQTDHV